MKFPEISPRRRCGIGCAQSSEASQTRRLSLKDAFELYENGKHRRYNLLFLVNGGAFAVAKLLTGEAGSPGVVLGALTLDDLSIAMGFFTIIMVADMFAFGCKMRKRHLPEAFDWRGKAVLLSLCLFICAGWLLVGLKGQSEAVPDNATDSPRVFGAWSYMGKQYRFVDDSRRIAVEERTAKGMWGNVEILGETASAGIRATYASQVRSRNSERSRHAASNAQPSPCTRTAGSAVCR